MTASSAPRFAIDRVSATALVSGLAVTAVVVWLLALTTTERDREAFQAAAQEAQAAIVARVETSVALLRGTAGLFATDRPITVSRFRDYVRRLALRERYPGLLGIAYARWLPEGPPPGLADELQRQGHPEFRVWPDAAAARSAIVFIEPFDERNRAAIGFDMWSNPVRREAMARAADHGTAAASGMVELVQEIDERKQPGFLIYLPVYETHDTPPTVEARRARLRGFAYTPIRAVDFLSSAFAYQETPEVGMEVYNGVAPDPAALLYARDTGVANPRFTARSTIDVAGQPWTFVFRSRVTRAQSLALPAAAAAIGIALSILLAVLAGRARRAKALAEQALEAERAARGEAERANLSKDQFLATLSHELRTPLHAILGWTSLLRSPKLREEQRLQGIEVIERNARSQARLIEDLLDMSRIASGKVSIERVPVDLAALVAEAVRSIQPAAEGKGLEVRSAIEAEGITVRGDPARLQQVVLNLLSNAMKFTPARGRIEVRVRRAPPFAQLQVADTGEGIEPDFLGRIFERFAQADASTTRRHGGLGLGLAIVRQLAELHGGRVGASSEGRGRGATFTVEIPLADEGADAAGDAAPAGPAHEMLRGIRVLAVDDDADARNLMQALLAARGAQVCAVGSARAALAAIQDTVPDVLLSDVGMADMDGYSLIRQVRALPPDRGGRVPAAAITAYARDADRDAALGAGFDAHLVKPLSGEALVDIVTRLARREA